MFWERFYSLCEMNGTKPNPVGKELGVSSGLITRWKQGIVMPDADTLLRIADYFSCTVDYLLGRSDDMAVSLPPDEEKLLTRYRGLDDDGREIVLSCALKELRRVNAERGEEAEAVG